MKTPSKRVTFSRDDLPVFDLDQIYMVSSLWYDSDIRKQIATYDLVVRDMPRNRNFMVFTGLEEIVNGILAWKYSDEQVELLLKNQLISEKFGKYLKRFKFTGDVYAMPEGTFFFPGEPVVRVTAPIIEGNLLTAFLITALSSNTVFSSKFIRSVIAAKDKSVIGVSPVRAHGFESAFKAQRASYIVGSNNAPSPIVRSKLEIPWGDPATIAYHAYISSFPTELEAMERAAAFAKFDLSLMVDTFDFKKGIQNAIVVAQERKKRKLKTKIVIDSGDLAAWCRYTRKQLDKEGLQDVTITLASNLDENKIWKMLKKKVPADTFIVNTEAITSSDDPRLEAVYKLAQIEKGKEVVHKMKLSKGKKSLPGKKQVYRVYKGNFFQKDIIGLPGERVGTPLLKQFIKRGKSCKSLARPTAIRQYVKRQLLKMPHKYLRVNKQYTYPVLLSNKLKR